MNITGTIVNYYSFCKRKCFLYFYNVGMENNSELVKIGRELHEQSKPKNKEILIDNIKIDKITKDYISELKKSDADIESALWQIKYYMYVLYTKGIIKNGKLEILEKNKQDSKTIYIKFEDKLIKEVETYIKEIEDFLLKESIPVSQITKKCKKCAYYEYCIL